jgi:hypothetical protein
VYRESAIAPAARRELKKGRLIALNQVEHAMGGVRHRGDARDYGCELKETRLVVTRESWPKQNDCGAELTHRDDIKRRIQMGAE